MVKERVYFLDPDFRTRLSEYKRLTPISPPPPPVRRGLFCKDGYGWWGPRPRSHRYCVDWCVCVWEVSALGGGRACGWTGATPQPNTLVKGTRLFEMPDQQSFAGSFVGQLMNRGWRNRQKELEEVVEALSATRNLKQVAKYNQSRNDVVRAIVSNRPKLRKVLEEHTRETAGNFGHKQLLERARVNFDVAAMLYQRVCNREELRRRIIHLNPDASPQNGHEIFCVKVEEILEGLSGDGTLDMSSVDMYEAPMIGLPRNHTTLFGKGMAMIHIIFLIAGPRAEEMRIFTQQVYSMLSDLGTEVGLGNFPDFLNAYLLQERMQVHSQVKDLFPRALVLPDWNHLVDNVFKDCLQGLTFWTDFREVLGEVTKFLRVRENREEVAKGAIGDERTTIMQHIKGLAGCAWSHAPGNHGLCAEFPPPRLALGGGGR